MSTTISPTAHVGLSARLQESTSRSRSRARRSNTADSLRTGDRWARQVVDPWWPCILALDGGGIRGYSSLLIIQELMHRIHFWEEELKNEPAISTAAPSRGRQEARNEEDASPGADNNDTMDEAAEGQHETTSEQKPFSTKVPPVDELLPCHYFDFMFGTSTGGLIATMLGRLRMTVPECLELYREVGESLFGRKRSSIPLFTKYYNEPLEKAVQEVVSRQCRAHARCDGTQCLHPWPSELARQVESAFDVDGRGQPFDVDQPRVCHSCCLTATHDEKPSVAYLLRSYSHYYPEEALDRIKPYNEGADPLKVWEVTRATSAAPFYFRMLETEIDGQAKAFKDGGIRENNPSGAALNEFNSLYYAKTDVPALLLSVGTGRPDSAQDGFASVFPGPFRSFKVVRQLTENLAILRNVLIRYTEGESLHDRIRSLVARGENTWYKRLNVDDGLQDMPLDDWTKGTWRGQPNVPGGKSLTRMEVATRRYLDRDFRENIDSYAQPSIMIDQAAQKLVRQRRAREQLGGERWTTFVGGHLPEAPTP
ncbi:hypothetical protein AMS68_005299 [Peltaster fructicola]|uniref:PNPLA domain-containing protein n=1 Tax=Peltaster fructicola TaxID=286661 RepID=A0A6H0XYD1_9PEZI|nr:hypothetical protein AMS68_005299 [Peltaster fructicola]